MSENDPQAASEADLAACFRLLLGRPPASANEWAAHRSLLGQPLGPVVQSYLDSPEHRRRVNRSGAPEAALRLTQKDGFAIYTDDDDLAVGRHVAGGSYQPEIAAALRTHLQPGMTVVDIGANIGYFTMLAASLVGPRGTVLAVEPNPANVRMIEASRRANGFNHVTVAGVAVGRGIGLLALDTGFSNGTTAEPASDLAALFQARLVPSVPLSRLLPSRPVDFIKIDAEGAEHTAIASVRDMIQRDRPVIVSEFSPTLLQTSSGVSGPDYLHLLTGLGYDLALIQPDGASMGADATAIMARYAQTPPHPLDLLLTPNAKRAWNPFRRRVR